MKKARCHRLTLVLCAVTAAACGGGAGSEPHVAAETENAAPAAASDLADAGAELSVIEVVPGELIGSWNLVAVNGAPVADIGTTPTLEILEDGSVGGNGGVNRFHSRVEMTGGRLRFGPVAATKMAGPQEAMDLESAYLKSLGAVSTYESDGETLHLWAGDNEVLTFERAEN